MTTAINSIVDRYLRQVADALAPLPEARRRDILDDLSLHIREALPPGEATELSVRQLIDDLGEPAEIAAAAGVTGHTVTRVTQFRRVGSLAPTCRWICLVRRLDYWPDRVMVIGRLEHEAEDRWHSSPSGWATATRRAPV